MERTRNEIQVAIPIETKVRELEAKAWLAMHFLSEGHQVVIGDISELRENLDLINPDAYLGTDARYQDIKYKTYKSLSNSGTKIYVLDTEGGIYSSRAAYRERLSADLLEYVDHFFAWGSDPADILISMGYPEKQVTVTGNPRFDLLQKDLLSIYQDQVDNLRSQYDSYILFNTNFTVTNHYHKKSTGRRFEYQKRLFEKFLDLIDLLDETVEQNIVIRPHPSEDETTYSDYFSSDHDIIINGEGDVRPWLIAASVVVHNSCTTGVESVLTRTPTVSYRPVKNSEYDLELPNKVSIEVESEKEAEREILRQSNGLEYSLTEDQHNELKKYIYNIQHKSAKDIASIVMESTPKTKEKFSGDGIPPLKRKIFRNFIDFYDIKNPNQFAEKWTHYNLSYRLNKFPGLSESELYDIFGLFSEQFDKDFHVCINRVEKTGNVFIVNNTNTIS